MRDIKEWIEQRRRQILVHSCLYYSMDASYIPDETFDRWSRELVELQEKYPDIAKKCVYHKYFKDFDGSSGFDLPYDLPEVRRKAIQLLNYRNNQ